MGFFFFREIFSFFFPEVEHRRIDVAIAYIKSSVFHVRVWMDVEKKTKYNDGGRQQNDDNSF